MLPIKHRLKKREDFAQIFSRGAYVGVNNLSIKYAKNSLLVSRFGFPVGKNYSKSAVVRNRARRILRAATAEFLVQIKPGFDVIILIKTTATNPEKGLVVKELEKVFKKANLFI